MIRTNIYIPERQREALKRIAEELEIKSAEVLRRAIDEYIERYDSKPQDRNKTK